MYEDEKLYRPAMERYRQASEYYLGEHFVPQSCQCLYKVRQVFHEMYYGVVGVLSAFSICYFFSRASASVGMEHPPTNPPSLLFSWLLFNLPIFNPLGGEH